jgi:putative RNA ligase
MARIDLAELQTEVDNHNIFRRFHSSGQFSILNYTPNCSYSKYWTPLTKQCRGLIIANDGIIIARPFEKFWNLSELSGLGIKLPNEPFTTFEKLDGSLGILYWFEGKPFISTRGGFESEQAIKATEMLRTKYRESIKLLDPDLTYLFEIIYPENRIVVDYGKEEKLIELAAITTETGIEINNPPNIGFSFPEIYPFTDMSSVQTAHIDGKEGFVLRFESGFRTKVKFEEYVKIHRLVTNLSDKRIWEYLSEGKDPKELLDQIPDEFFNTFDEIIQRLQKQYIDIEIQTLDLIGNIKQITETKKEAAALIKKTEWPGILFAIYNKKDYSQLIWKAIKPDSKI